MLVVEIVKDSLVATMEDADAIMSRDRPDEMRWRGWAPFDGLMRTKEEGREGGRAEKLELSLSLSVIHLGLTAATTISFSGPAYKHNTPLTSVREKYQI